MDASARIGSLAAPLLVSAESGAVGAASARAGAEVSGILGTYDAIAADFSQLQAGGKQGLLSADALLSIDLSAQAVNGAATASLTDAAGSSADVTGIRNIDLTLGAGNSRVDAFARGRSDLLAESVQQDASSTATSTSSGILSNAADSISISFAQTGKVASLASQSLIAEAPPAPSPAPPTASRTWCSAEGMTCS